MEEQQSGCFHNLGEEGVRLVEPVHSQHLIRTGFKERTSQQISHDAWWEDTSCSSQSQSYILQDKVTLVPRDLTLELEDCLD